MTIWKFAAYWRWNGQDHVRFGTVKADDVREAERLVRGTLPIDATVYVGRSAWNREKTT